jgi:hypothetical protein
VSLHPLATLFVALLTLTAGCLGGLGADLPTGDDAPPTDGATLSDPERVLYDAGSFTASWRYAGTDGDGVRSEIRYDYRADLAGNRSHVAYATRVDDEDTPGAWEAYSTGGRTYTRYDAGGEPFYQVAEGGADVVEDALSRAGAYGAGDLSDMRRVGTETFDGVAVTRYEVTDADDWFVGGTVAGLVQADRVTDFRYVVLVDEDGLARSESWSFTGATEDGQTVTGEWEYSITRVGATDFADPDWLADAEAAATPTSSLA